MAIAPNVSIEEVAKRLHVSRNYIHTSILPYVKHEKTAQYRVRIDEGELRFWLKTNASFSRQTIVLLPEFPDEYDQYTDKLEKLGINLRVPPPTARKMLPFRYVKPFDFWDKELTFPDDDRFAHAESFYRAMYACGAIKIKLGERKTLFYAPMLHTGATNDEDYNFDAPFPSQPIKTKQGEQVLLRNGYLYPALDDEKDTEQASAQVEKQKNILIDIKGEEPYTQAIADYLVKICSNGHTNEEDKIQIKYSKNHKTAHITLPQKVVDHWVNPEEFHTALNLAEGMTDDNNPVDLPF